MPFKLSLKRHPLYIAAALFLVLLLGVALGYVTNHIFSENAKFQRFTRELFAREISANTLTLHYNLAHPEKAGIDRPSPTLGTVSADNSESVQLCMEYEEKLKSFSYSRLSRENQLTLDSLLLYFHTQQAMGKHSLLQEMISPSLGIQAQLPVLLAEYAFYEDQDITDYLNLLSQIRPYFQSILKFQQAKSEAGYFMSDITLDRVLEQCSAFIDDPDSNYMLEIFARKLEDYGKFSPEDQEKLNARHKEILLGSVIPAYRELMKGLNDLRGTGGESRGLAHYKGGREYYQLLLRDETGSYVPVKKIQQRLLEQLNADTREIAGILKENPGVLAKLYDEGLMPSYQPEKILQYLQKKMAGDFPGLKEPEYHIRYVHKSMEDYLSPAFYLTPPLDTGTPNIIYINGKSSTSALSLFTTLAHEGFPGHLYQELYFQTQRPQNIRSLFHPSGYVEGWATYIESYAYEYAASLIEDKDGSVLTRLAWLNRSVTLNLYSLLDIGIHYQGFDQSRTAALLRTFGIQDKAAAEEIFQYIVETPGNYLKYYWGYLNFLDLKAHQQQVLGEDFDLKKFHESILKLGPVPFPVLEKYFRQETFVTSEKTPSASSKHLSALLSPAG